MTTFAYKALGPGGKTTSGTLTADTRAAAIAQLAGKGLHPMEMVEEKGMAAKRQAVVGKQGKVSQKAIESFTREMANLLAGGVPLARALALLRREASNPAAKFLWGEINDDVVQGTALADAMAKFPANFSTVYIAMVRAGEQGGFLDVVLNQIADFRAREQELKGKVKAALVYPCVLACLAVGVLIFLMTFFIPRFTPMFAQFGAALPYLTQVIIAVSNVMTSAYALVVAVAVVMAVIFIRRASKTEVGKRRIEQVILATPALGTVIGNFALVRFCRMLGTLLGSGVPLVSSLRTAREAIGNQTLSDTVSKAIEEVQRGSSLSKALITAPKLFPPTVIEMVAVAEETGRLDKELVRLSMTYEGELDRNLRLLVSLAEPLLLFLMAGMIGTIVIGMLLPIFNMQDLIK